MDVTSQRKLYLSSKDHGYIEVDAHAIVLAMGCERSRAQVRIPGIAQRRLPRNCTALGERGRLHARQQIRHPRFRRYRYDPARRLTFEGAKVERVLEINLLSA